MQVSADICVDPDTLLRNATASTGQGEISRECYQYNMHTLVYCSYHVVHLYSCTCCSLNCLLMVIMFEVLELFCTRIIACLTHALTRSHYISVATISSSSY